MLPPINSRLSYPESNKRRGGTPHVLPDVAAQRPERSDGDNTGRSHGISHSNNGVLERMESLERETLHLREEVLHLRQQCSSNQTHRDDERLSLTKVSEDLQRIVNAFNSKAQADALFQQREQQKAALLFAEVARLGHTVESLEHTIRTLAEDTGRVLDRQEQRLQMATARPVAAGNTSPLKRMHDTISIQLQQQSEETQQNVLMLKNTVAQLRVEIDSDRNERWKLDSERQHWLSELRTMVNKMDATMEVKIASQLERVHSKLMSDKMETLRLLEEHRELVSGADFKRLSTQMMEFSRINDHLLALEQWIRTEHNAIKRIFQLFSVDNDNRFQVLVHELADASRLWHGVLVEQDDQWRGQLSQVLEAVQEVSNVVQKKVFALEEVVPMEVKARQKHDEKLRRRVESAVKSLSRAIDATREDFSSTHSLTPRVGDLECAYQRVLEHINGEVETVRSALKETESKLEQLCVVMESKAQEAVCAMTPDVPEPAQAESRDSGGDVPQDGAEEPLVEAPAHPDGASEQAWETALTVLSESIMEELRRRHNEIVSKVEALESEHNEALEGLRHWATTHAQECRQCYEYLQYRVEQNETEVQVQSCLSGLVDAVVSRNALSTTDSKDAGGLLHLGS
ncbi:hypothetical protein Poli38472_005639 [Pythium oligandrum]|uniref:Uncharacterized protein n=1 Tax=Pythium oligandrum TaxID=41045 RepID=A0A8K1CGD4_PYTOL|nr:hypothetical protein Poli38472_005639 [Pythium oligandrum]|eukprot:TMW63021.1 hypothetical protein Poli38472_005639 [Pythium oligandrum]